MICTFCGVWRVSEVKYEFFLVRSTTFVSQSLAHGPKRALPTMRCTTLRSDAYQCGLHELESGFDLVKNHSVVLNNAQLFS